MSGKHEFCPGEKRMIVNSYEYFKSQKEQGLFKGIRTRQLVSDCLGCARASRGRTTYAKFVEGSIQCWNASKKRKQDETEDYHGNFNSELFEAWFEKLCKTLEDNYGGCNIHMDGAGYHKQMTNLMPTTKSLRSWLEAHINTVVMLVYNRAANRDVLLSLAKLNKPKAVYAANTIATRYNNRPYYTPPVVFSGS
ncbi:uncharacterized protein PITG_20100 [Phytophthora infestans T30-4]|uniref:Tc1-like transposase DDE domain-containing protein n=1 Tax=Phytophthora infestans (strain T30-4) TaxID=403677 RepID=D0P0S2_PHYIT|nr:uncharacterized protein PITG_20100 [Phytophthora infestans T30-4]EEY53040.1 conserved hypothetical protein [Phytophthora infestans T30-4]|eukprot:XP_002896110.1 conserved hypothetical protein [Phytophthora infestans T30-4]